MRAIYTYYFMTFILSNLQLTLLGSQQVYWIQEEGKTKKEEILIDYEYGERFNKKRETLGSKGFATPIVDKEKCLSIPFESKLETIPADWEDMVQRELAVHELCRQNGLITLQPKQVDVYAEKDSEIKLCTTLLYPSYDALADKRHYVIRYTVATDISRWSTEESILLPEAPIYEKESWLPIIEPYIDDIKKVIELGLQNYYKLNLGEDSSIVFVIDKNITASESKQFDLITSYMARKNDLKSIPQDLTGIVAKYTVPNKCSLRWLGDDLSSKPERPIPAPMLSIERKQSWLTHRIRKDLWNFFHTKYNRDTGEKHMYLSDEYDTLLDECMKHFASTSLAFVFGQCLRCEGKRCLSVF